LARPLNIEGVLDLVADPSFTVAVGLVLWGCEQEVGNFKGKPLYGGNSNGAFRKVLSWLKNFLP
jgi:hypothetical protein